nr:MAG TPA: hypothetical protein [Caudoviricetes sp.]
MLQRLSRFTLQSIETSNGNDCVIFFYIVYYITSLSISSLHFFPSVFKYDGIPKEPAVEDAHRLRQQKIDARNYSESIFIPEAVFNYHRLNFLCIPSS